MQAESIYQLDSLVGDVGGQMLSLNRKVNRVIELEKDKQRMDEDLWIEKMDELLKKNLEEFDQSMRESSKINDGSSTVYSAERKNYEFTSETIREKPLRSP